MQRILVADDEPRLRRSVRTALELEGYEVLEAGDGREALASAEAGEADLVLLDIEMPGMNGMEVLRALHARPDAPPVLVLTAHGTIARAVEAVRLGAADFLEKPPHAERLLLSVRNALLQARLRQECRGLGGAGTALDRMLGDSAVMQSLRAQIRKVAPTSARVLITGEHGTGKELVARALHDLSSRAHQPFVAVNCAAVPRELMEGEMFGYERGAFTGAARRHTGWFQRAHEGTLFLDEIGDLPLELQPKLLRVLETCELQPLGSERSRRVDVRVLAATNRALEEAVERGGFRGDLFYRLDVVRLHVPPLRERGEDVPALARWFLARACEELHVPARTLAPEAEALLVGYCWPGNIREVRNLMERIAILGSGPEVTAREVREFLRHPGGAAVGGRAARAGTLRARVAEAEREAILSALEGAAWNISQAARTLGVERSHLYKKLRTLGIRRPDPLGGGPGTSG